LLADRRVVEIAEPAAALLERAVLYSEDATWFPSIVDTLVSDLVGPTSGQIEARREFLAGYGRRASTRGIVDDAVEWIEQIIAGQETYRPRL
jgi:hypothetical protein